MSSDFYATSIVPFAPIIIKICRAYTNTQKDFEDSYQEVCLQIWRSRRSFDERAAWSTWIYRVSLNVCMTLLKTHKRNRRTFASDVVPPEFVEDSRAFADESLNQLYDAIRQLSEVDRAVAPKVNDLYTRKSTHIVDRIQRMLRINQIAIVIAAPIAWVLLSAVGIPYAGAIMWAAWTGLVVIRRLYIAKFDPPDNALTAITTSRRFTGG